MPYHAGTYNHRSNLIRNPLNIFVSLIARLEVLRILAQIVLQDLNECNEN
jgi:hypothetical protein